MPIDKGLSDPAHRPIYYSGALIPMEVARWFYNNPVDRIELIPNDERKGDSSHNLRYFSGSKFIDYHTWGVELTNGKDRQGRASMVETLAHDEIAEILAWEMANPSSKKPVPAKQ